MMNPVSEGLPQLLGLVKPILIHSFRPAKSAPKRPRDPPRRRARSALSRPLCEALTLALCEEPTLAICEELTLALQTSLRSPPRAEIVARLRGPCDPTKTDGGRHRSFIRETCWSTAKNLLEHRQEPAGAPPRTCWSTAKNLLEHRQEPARAPPRTCWSTAKNLLEHRQERDAVCDHRARPHHAFASRISRTNSRTNFRTTPACSLAAGPSITGSRHFPPKKIPW